MSEDVKKSLAKVIRETSDLSKQRDSLVTTLEKVTRRLDKLSGMQEALAPLFLGDRWNGADSLLKAYEEDFEGIKTLVESKK
jgi:hypothetical protein